MDDSRKLVTKVEVERMIRAHFTNTMMVSLSITMFLIGYFVSSLVN